MTEIESLMDQHSDVQSIRTLYAVYRTILHEIRAHAQWMRDPATVVNLDHEASCLESQARSLEQNFARQMRERIKAEAAKVET